MNFPSDYNVHWWVPGILSATCLSPTFGGYDTGLMLWWHYILHWFVEEENWICDHLRLVKVKLNSCMCYGSPGEGGYLFAHPVIPSLFLCTEFLRAKPVSKSHWTSFSGFSGRLDLDLGPEWESNGGSSLGPRKTIMTPILVVSS